MTIGSGIATQIGFADESVFNTPVAVSRFLEVDSETLDRRPNFIQGVGLRAGGLVPRASRRQESTHDAGGQVMLKPTTKGMGLLLRHMFGSHGATATQLSTSAAYQQIHNSGSSDGHSFTTQKGIPSTDGTVNPFTLSGCKITEWDLTAAVNAAVQLSLTIDAAEVVPDGGGVTALQTASYSGSSAEFGMQRFNANLFSAMTVVSGVWTPTSPTSPGVVRAVSLKGGQPKDTARWQAGSSAKAEQLTNDFQPITGQIDVDFASMALYNQFAADTATGLAIVLNGGLIPGGAGFSFALAITLPAVFLEQGSTPKASGPGVVTVQYPFTALDDGTNGALQAVYVSTDTTP